MPLDDAALKEIEDHAVEFARGAGRILETYFGKAIDVQFKSDDKTNPVSQADKESEEYLRGAISKLFPDHSILGEEGPDEGPANSDSLWALDPLDGTLNYINGFPIYSVSIGMLHKGAPVVGAVWVPRPGVSNGSVYHARRGHGTYLDDKPVYVCKNPAPQAGQLAIMPREFRRRYHRKAGRGAPVGEIRGPGSIAYEMALTSSGTLQYAAFTSPRLWDIAAGVVLVQEAGGAALTYVRNRSRWYNLKHFPIPGVDGRGGLTQLREWSAPIMVGNLELVEYLAQFLRPGWFARMVRRLTRAPA